MNISRTTFFRIFLGFFLVGSLFLGSIWLTLGLGFIGLFFYPYYWEFLVIAVCVEALFGGGVHVRTASAFLPLFALLLFGTVEASRAIIREEILRR